MRSVVWVIADVNECSSNAAYLGSWFYGDRGEGFLQVVQRIDRYFRGLSALYCLRSDTQQFDELLQLR